MVNLVRKNQKIFAANATNNGQFGSLQDGSGIPSNDIDVLQANSAYEEGWNDATISGDELPALEEFQGLNYVNTSQIAYIMQKGIPEWEVATDYYIGDITREVGGAKLYKSLTDNNEGNILTDIVNWKLYYDPENSTFENLTVNKKFNLARTSEGIISGAIDFVGTNLVVGSEGGAPTDDLTDILGGVVGDVVILETASNSQVITVKHDFLATSNIRLAYDRDVILASVQDRLVLQQNNSGIWIEVSRAILGDFLSVKAANGYTYLPNGYLFQQGRIEDATSSGTIVFLEAFSSTPTVIMGSGSSPTDTGGVDLASAVRETTVTATQFQYSKRGTDHAYWWAIGN